MTKWWQSWWRGKTEPQRNIHAEWEAKMTRHRSAGDVHISKGFNAQEMLCGETMDWLKEHQPDGATCNPWITTLNFAVPADFFADSRVPYATCPQCLKEWAALRNKARGARAYVPEDTSGEAVTKSGKN